MNSRRLFMGLGAALGGITLAACQGPVKNQEPTPAVAAAADCIVVRVSMSNSDALTVELRCGDVRWDATRFSTRGDFYVTSSVEEGWTLERARVGTVVGKPANGTAVVFDLRHEDGQKCEVHADFFDDSVDRLSARSSCERFNGSAALPA